MIEYDIKSMALLSMLLLIMKIFMVVPWWVIFFPLYGPIVIMILVALTFGIGKALSE